MGYLEAKSVPACLRNHYEKLLFPYDVFQSGLMTDTPTEVPNGDLKQLSKCCKSRYLF